MEETSNRAILESALKTQFTAENERMSRGWFMIMVGAIILTFAFMLTGSANAFLFFVGAPVSVAFGSFGVFEIRRVRHLLLKIRIGEETGEVETLRGTLTSYAKKGGKGPSGKYFLTLDKKKKVRIPPNLYKKLEPGTPIEIQRARHSKTLLELTLLEQ